MSTKFQLITNFRPSIKPRNTAKLTALTLFKSLLPTNPIKRAEVRQELWKPWKLEMHCRRVVMVRQMAMRVELTGRLSLKTIRLPRLPPALARNALLLQPLLVMERLQKRLLQHPALPRPRHRQLGRYVKVGITLRSPSLCLLGFFSSNVEEGEV
jgi:hypothetical protein